MVATLLHKILWKGSHLGEEGDLTVLGNYLSLVVLWLILLTTFTLDEGKLQKHGCYTVAKVTGERQPHLRGGRPDCSRECYNKC